MHSKTQNAAAAGPFDLEAAGDLAAFRKALDHAGYTDTALNETMAITDAAGKLDVPFVRRRTAKVTPFNTFFRLFVLGEAVSEQNLRGALQPAPLEQLLAAGLCHLTAAGVRSAARLAPYGGRLFLGDFVPHDQATLSADHVLGVGPASASLASMTVRRRAETVLDVGTGAGVQAILAAPHADRVLGTDTNPRALNFAAMNAQLNGIENIRWRTGSFFEPMAGEHFDLVVSNPPFVISPQSRFIFRDGGMKGDGVSEHVVTRAGAHLKEGGYAIVLVNWHHRSQEDWAERPKQWVEDNGCDTWIMRFQNADPLSYAANWLRQMEAHEPERYGQLLDEWLQYYDQNGIGWLSSGVVIMRQRSSGTNWGRCDSLPAASHVSECGEQIQRIFAAEDFLQGADSDERLLAQRCRLHPDHRLDRRLVVQEGKWQATANRFEVTRGLAFSGAVDAPALRLLAGCDGTRPLREVIRSVAEAMQADTAELAPGCLQVAKRFLRTGILVVDQTAAPA